MALEDGGLGDILSGTAFALLKVSLVPLAIILAAGLAAGTIQTGIIVTTEQIRPKLSNIGLKRGFKKMFSTRALADFGKGMVKLAVVGVVVGLRSAEHTSELQSLMRISYAVFCLKKTNH